MRKVSPVTGQPDYPGAGWLITSGFATDAYFQRFGDWHTGHDLARSREGNEPIYAIADGKVIWAENAGNGGFGNLVVVQHNDKLFSRYAHLSRIDVAEVLDERLNAWESITDQFGPAEVEVVEDLQPRLIARGNRIENIIHRGREVVVDEPAEVFLE